MCFSNETTLKQKINAYFIVELIISIISILCPMFLLITIISYFCIFMKPEKSWNWDELDEETLKNAKIKCWIILIMCVIPLLMWSVIFGILGLILIGIPLSLIMLMSYFIHIYLCLTVLVDHPKEIMKTRKEENV
jgi:hypothetical protein